jgi:arylsulfatase
MAFGSYSGIGQGGTGVLRVDGKDVATKQMESTLPFILQWDEALDIGSDTGTPVNDADYKSPFTFTGTLGKITLTVDRPKLSPEDIKKLEDARKALGVAK